MTNITDALKQQVVEDIARSGLVLSDISGSQMVGADGVMPLSSKDDADAADFLNDSDGYNPYEDDDEDDDQAVDEQAEAIGGYTIPYYTLDGKPIIDQGEAFQRIRLVGRKNDDVPRYRSPKGSANHVYIPQGLPDLLKSLELQNSVVSETGVLIITEGEKKAIKAVKSGIPCIALPGITMWADSAEVRKIREQYKALGGDPRNIPMSEKTPVNRELLDAIAQIKAKCPSIGVVSVMFDSDGQPIEVKNAFVKSKNGTVPAGGVEWKPCHTPMKGQYFSANPQVSSAAYMLSTALRSQLTSRAVIATQFCQWETSNDAIWVKQGLDDMLVVYGDNRVSKSIRKKLKSPIKLWNVIGEVPLFGCNVDPDILSSKGGVSAEVAFQRMLDGRLIGKTDGLLYEWVGSHWQKIEQPELHNAANILIDSFYSESGSARKVSEAPKMAVSAPHLYKVPNEVRNKKVGSVVIPCADFTLDISEKGDITAREPDKSDGLRYCIDAKWSEKDKPSPEFDKFIKEVLPDAGVRRLVQQYVGYTLIGDCRFQVAQWWFGNGANGKGFLAKIIAALHHKVAAADIADLGGFGAENLIDASLITVDETPRRIDEQRLKSAISGDALPINRKYLPPITVQLKAKWLLRGNDKPSLSDQTDGMWRRLQVIEFTEKFDGDRRDDTLADRIIANELAGVLRWAIEGLIMLLKAGGFKDIPEAVQVAKREMQIETDNVLGWWDDKSVQVCDAPRISKDEVYQDYTMWCRVNGMMPLGAPRFWSRVGSIVKRDMGGLTITRARETSADPLTGGKKTKRVYMVNLDIESDHDVVAENVVSFQRKAEVKTPAQDQSVKEDMDTHYEELDDGDIDLGDVPL
ncbi:phage/plasmid primase, P4 family [Methylovulum sp.]|uniref:phage/plasmid primase, P4 family n=1 Tax=Methylovulum sp. TaxID=1916980 RepID=UPI0026266F7E|nr:phage/plasmid primase, P4 family [Methylovulum sp.]MDD5125267.1 phage/plasmid primase, P4 family [Methylovulum sp.]